MMHSYQCQVCLRQRTSHWLLHSIPTQKMLQFIGFQNRRLSAMVLYSHPWCAGWWWSACISQWIWFWWWIIWFTGVWFLCRTFLDNKYSVAKGILYVVGGRENVVTGFFKTECGGCHVTIDRCSGKKVIMLGSCWCYFLILRAPFFKVFVIGYQMFLVLLWYACDDFITVTKRLSVSIESCPLPLIKYDRYTFSLRNYDWCKTSSVCPNEWYLHIDASLRHDKLWFPWTTS